MSDNEFSDNNNNINETETMEDDGWNDEPDNNGNKTSGGNDEDWGDDLSPAVAELDIQIKGMIQTDDLDKPLADRCDQFNRIVEVK